MKANSFFALLTGLAAGAILGLSLIGAEAAAAPAAALKLALILGGLYYLFMSENLTETELYDLNQYLEVSGILRFLRV